jgi:hypothetical protein
VQKADRERERQKGHMMMSERAGKRRLELENNCTKGDVDEKVRGLE